MEFVKIKTSAQRNLVSKTFWGKDVIDICIGDKFRTESGKETYSVRDIEAYDDSDKARIHVTVAYKFVGGYTQSGMQWFNQDANIVWLS